MEWGMLQKYDMFLGWPCGSPGGLAEEEASRGVCETTTPQGQQCTHRSEAPVRRFVLWPQDVLSVPRGLQDIMMMFGGIPMWGGTDCGSQLQTAR